MEEFELSVEKVSEKLRFVKTLKGQIPNFVKIRVQLYNLFVNETGLAHSLVRRYYHLHKPEHDFYIFDPRNQMIWCHDHIPIFSTACRRIRQVRNKIAHNDLLTPNLFRDTVHSIAILYQNDKEQDVKEFLIQLLEICDIIIDGKKTIIKPIVETLDELELFIKLKREQTDRLLSDEQKPIEILGETNYEFDSIKTYKEKGYQEALKGCRIAVMNGFYNGKIGTFRSWSGSICYIDLDEIGIKQMRIACTYIKILSYSS